MTSEKTNGSLLSDRELDIMELTAKGLTYKQIADKLYISPKTVRTHLSNIYKKLKVNNKVAAINEVKKR
jgi:DNA-binding CsgD family transcriptional regulator